MNHLDLALEEAGHDAGLRRVLELDLQGVEEHLEQLLRVLLLVPVRARPAEGLQRHHDKTRQGAGGQQKARRGEARRGEARRGEARGGEAKRGALALAHSRLMSAPLPKELVSEAWKASVGYLRARRRAREQNNKPQR